MTAHRKHTNVLIPADLLDDLPPPQLTNLELLATLTVLLAALVISGIFNGVFFVGGIMVLFSLTNFDDNTVSEVEVTVTGDAIQYAQRLDEVVPTYREYEFNYVLLLLSLALSAGILIGLYQLNKYISQSQTRSVKGMDKKKERQRIEDNSFVATLDCGAITGSRILTFINHEKTLGHKRVPCQPAYKAKDDIKSLPVTVRYRSKSPKIHVPLIEPVPCAGVLLSYDQRPVWASDEWVFDDLSAGGSRFEEIDSDYDDIVYVSSPGVSEE